MWLYLFLMTTKKIIHHCTNNHHLPYEGTSSIGILDATNTTLVRRQRVLETCFAAAQEADLSDEAGLFTVKFRGFLFCVFFFSWCWVSKLLLVGWLLGFVFVVFLFGLVLLLVGLG